MTRERLTAKVAATLGAPEKKKEKKEHAGEARRNLDGFEYDTSKAIILKKALHNLNVSLGTLLSAMKDLSLLRGSEITPDGMIGGRGFIMPFKEIKTDIATSIDDLSNITDSIADELTNPKWGLSTEDKKKVKLEKEEIQDEIEEVEEEVPEMTQDSIAPEQPEPLDQPEPVSEGMSPNMVTPPDDMMDNPAMDVGPGDVRDSAEVAQMKKYRDLIEGNAKDKVACMLSKNIMANLVKGV